MKPTICAVYIVYNQRSLLKKSLSVLSGKLDQILIADLSSTEDLKSLAHEFGATYLKLPYTEVVETARDNVFAKVKTEYILYLDADETISPNLIPELRRCISDNLDYLLIPRQNYIFGTWVKASRWWPDYQVRFFRRGVVRWPTKLHHQPELRGTSRTLVPDPKLAIIHHNYRSVDEWLDKDRRYAKTDAQDRIKSGESYTISQAMRLSISELVSRFFAGRGWEDGMHGLLLSILQSFYYFLVYSYYWEAKAYKSESSSKDLGEFPRQWFTHGLSEIMYWDSKNHSLTSKLKAKLVRKIIA